MGDGNCLFNAFDEAEVTCDDPYSMRRRYRYSDMVDIFLRNSSREGSYCGMAQVM